MSIKLYLIPKNGTYLQIKSGECQKDREYTLMISSEKKTYSGIFVRF